MAHWTTSQEQPSLREMLDEPIVRLLMVRDGVTREDVEELLAALELTPRHDESRPILRLSASTLQIPSRGDDRVFGQPPPGPGVN